MRADTLAPASPRSPQERGRLLAALIWLTLAGLWLVWVLSLSLAPFLFLAFDNNVSVAQGAALGAVQATWVAAIPVALLFGGHVVDNGWTPPQWRARWLIVIAAAALWCLILAFWISTAATI